MVRTSKLIKKTVTYHLLDGSVYIIKQHTVWVHPTKAISMEQIEMVGSYLVSWCVHASMCACVHACAQILSLLPYTGCDMPTLLYTGTVCVQDRVVRSGLHVDARSSETVWLEAEHGRDRPHVEGGLYHQKVRTGSVLSM